MSASSPWNARTVFLILPLPTLAVLTVVCPFITVKASFGITSWSAFLILQAIQFACCWSYLNLVRLFTGKTIHGFKDPFGAIDGAGFVLLTFLILVFTDELYRRVAGNTAPPLGFSLSSMRTVNCLLGMVIGFLVQSIPWLLGLTTGCLKVEDRVWAHFNPAGVVRVLCVGMFFLTLSSVLEEGACRAFPMALWERYPLAIRILVPSFFFAVLHLADERFDLLKFYERFMFGVVLSVAYALTNNIWFAVGLHTGINYACMAVNGLWHAAAVVDLSGRLGRLQWAPEIIWTVIGIAGFFALHTHVHFRF
jgi:membrane protease YdiL (CAAX protease family)